MAYRPRFSIYTPTKRLRFPTAWTVMELHEARDDKLVSTQRTRDFMWWLPPERKYLKRLHVGAYGTWQTIRSNARGKALSLALRWKVEVKTKATTMNAPENWIKDCYSVGDIVMWRDRKFGHNRAWEVEAILLGAEGVEGLVRLRPMFLKGGSDEHGNRQETTLVPECLLRDLEWFAKRSHSTVQ